MPQCANHETLSTSQCHCAWGCEFHIAQLHVLAWVGLNKLFQCCYISWTPHSPHPMLDILMVFKHRNQCPGLKQVSEQTWQPPPPTTTTTTNSMQVLTLMVTEFLLPGLHGTGAGVLQVDVDVGTWTNLIPSPPTRHGADMCDCDTWTCLRMGESSPQIIKLMHLCKNPRRCG